MHVRDHLVPAEGIDFECVILIERKGFHEAQVLLGGMKNENDPRFDRKKVNCDSEGKHKFFLGK